MQTQQLTAADMDELFKRLQFMPSTLAQKGTKEIIETGLLHGFHFSAIIKDVCSYLDIQHRVYAETIYKFLLEKITD